MKIRVESRYLSAAALFVATKDDVRVALRHVVVRPGLVEASDGHTMFRCTDPSIESDGVYLIPVPAIKQMCRAKDPVIEITPIPDEPLKGVGNGTLVESDQSRPIPFDALIQRVRATMDKPDKAFHYNPYLLVRFADAYRILKGERSSRQCIPILHQRGEEFAPVTFPGVPEAFGVIAGMRL